MNEIVNMDLGGLFREAELLASAGNKTAAINLYRIWLAQVTSPVAYAARFNLASLLSDSQNVQEAEALLREALAENPNFHEARFNLGSALEKQGQIDEALATWAELISLLDNNSGQATELLIMALNHSGRVKENIRQFAEAEQLLRKSLYINPDQTSVIHHWVHLRQKMCAWPIYDELPNLTKEDLLAATSALAMLDITDDPAIQLAAAQHYVEEKINLDAPPLSVPGQYVHKRLRIGYLSSDFCLHAVSLLTVQLFELHDRTKFEVYGFSWSRQDGSYLRQRVQAALDHYVSITTMTDSEAAQCIRDHEIDILVDLQGLTSGARANILAMRPAPLQLTYLGFPGTTGLPCLDYVLCDRYILPEQMARYFTEKPLYLPQVFQISDCKRPVNATPSRSELGLPEDYIVFCAFNNNHKFTPELFATWLNILKRVDGSVLWLLQDNIWVNQNLIALCQAHGVDENRLIFAERAAPADYLARYKAADLFLDCFPFNGGTTANDALFMGLPILTRSGRSFASRMAGSLLRQFGLDELIVDSFAAYEELAVNLATHPDKLQNIRRDIEAQKEHNPLFDIPARVKDIETALEQALAEKTAMATALQNSASVIGLFFGIVVRMHGHVKAQIKAGYQQQTVIVDIGSGDIVDGHFDCRQQRLLLAWVEIHREDLLANWQLSIHGEAPLPIEPLK
ncbi:MAG: tetratricopeptide repeat protein [Methylococcales bacterium]